MIKKQDPLWVRCLPNYFYRLVTGRVALHSIIHNSGWLILDKVIRAFLGLLVGAWMARYLGPSNFGTLSYVIAYVTFFQAFANLGLDTIVVREIARQSQMAPLVLGTTLLMRVCSGIFAILIASSFMAFQYDWDSQIFLITLLVSSSLIFQVSDTVDLWFQSQSQNYRTITVKVLSYLISNGLKIVGILQGASLTYFAVLISVEAAISAFGLMLAYKKYPALGHWYFAISKAKILLHESWPFLLSSISVIVYMRLDQLLIKNYLGSTDLGIYAAALPIASVWSALPIAMCTSVAPFLARFRISEPTKYEVGFRMLFKYFFWFSLSISVTISFFADQIIELFYGVAYAESTMVLRIYVFTNIPVFLGVAQYLWIANEGRSTTALKNTVFGGACAIAADFLLIPQFGLVGAAFAAVIAYFASAVLGNLFFCKELFFMQLGLKNK